MGWNTPHAPAQGSVRSSNFSPRSVIPSLYIFSQSLRDARSLSMSSVNSPASNCKSPASITSTRFWLKSSSSSASGSISSSTSPILIFTDSGSSISISISGSSSAKALNPCGASYKLFSMLIIFSLVIRRFTAVFVQEVVVFFI